ncbi:MAG: glycosyltransferase family 39 protein [Alphaproteobacteria bacterium]|nr:glycosyltransferase family 39 protein [Alphaproteobacteria bacterium]
MRKITYRQVNGILFLISLVFFLFLNSHSLLYLDEMATMLKMRMSFDEMMRFLLTQDVHLPVYFILLKSWLSVFGVSVFAARCFSYLGLLACAFGGGALVKKLYGEKAGVWFTALFLFMPVSFWFARTIRMYAWACFFCTMAFLTAQSALLKGERKDFILYVVYAFLGAWTHYYASLTCALIAVAYLVLSFKKDKEIFKKFFLANSVLFLIVCPQVYIFLHQKTIVATVWQNMQFALDAYRTFFSDFSHSRTLEKGAFFITSGLWIVCAQFLMKEKNGDRQVVLTGLFMAFGVYYLTFIISFLYHPILIDRYLTVALGGLFLAFTLGIVSDKRNEIIFGVLIAAAFFVTADFCRTIVSQSVQPAFVEAVKKNVTANDVIVANDWRGRFLLYYFFPGYDIRTVAKGSDNIFMSKLKVIDEKDIFELASKKNVFFVGNDDFCQQTQDIFVNTWDRYLQTFLGLKKAISCDEKTVP